MSVYRWDGVVHLSPVWLCPDDFIPDFIVIDVIYYFLIAYNVWLYVYTFRRILLFLYVVECRFSLVFIGFMPFMVLWSYFCLCRILPLYMVACIGELLYYIFFVYQRISIILTIYNTYISIYCLNCFKSIYNLIPCLLLSRPMIVSRYPIKF